MIQALLGYRNAEGRDSGLARGAGVTGRPRQNRVPEEDTEMYYAVAHCTSCYEIFGRDSALVRGAGVTGRPRQNHVPEEDTEMYFAVAHCTSCYEIFSAKGSESLPRDIFWLLTHCILTIGRVIAWQSAAVNRYYLFQLG